MSRRNAALLLAVVGTALILALLFLWMGSSQTDAEVLPSTARPSATKKTVARAAVDVDAEWIKRLGLAVETTRYEMIAPSIRVAATLTPDEGRVSHIHARVAGWVEQVHVQYTGQAVRAGQPLVSIYSQELYSSQREYLSAVAGQGRSPPSLVVSSSRERLRALGMSEGQIRSIQVSGKAQRLVVVSSPEDGVVLRRPVPPGTAVDPSTELLTLVNLSQVWAVAEVPERDSGLARPGARARLELATAGARPLETSVDFVSPTVSERSRSIRVRVVLDNSDGRLRPGLSGTLEIHGEPERLLTVPREAVVDNGSRQFIYVAGDNGRFVPRQVLLGTRTSARVAVLQGLAEGEPVLASGAFLIDSESRLRGSGAMPGHAGHGGKQAPDAKSVPNRDTDAHQEHQR